jgi:predicted permease
MNKEIGMGSFFQDIKYGLRMLAKNPGFSVVAIITLALGIGANTAMFSAVNGIVLRPLPYKDPSQLVNVWGSSADYPGFRMTLSVPEFNDLKSQNRSFESMAAYRNSAMNWTGHGDPEVISITEISHDFFPALGVSPAAGRIFTPEEDVPGKDQVVILSDALWKTRFGGDPAIIGKTITLDTSPYTVVGIMPRNFQFQDSGDESPTAWKPLALPEKTIQSREERPAFVLARLRRGVTLAQAQADSQIIADRMAQADPKDEKGQGLTIMNLKEGVVGGLQRPLLVLLAAVGFVLLIACVNVANLFLARSWKRRREIAVRAALGATRARLIRQLLVESVLLSIAGGLAGLAVGTWGIDIVRSFAPSGTPRIAQVGLDLTVLWFTLGIAMLTGIIFGLAPALQASRPDLNATLKEGSGISGSGYGARGHHRLRSLLVVSEVALAVILLIGSALMLKSFSRLINTNPGFRVDHALTAEIKLPESKYKTDEQQRAFFETVLTRIQHLPGVQSAAFMSSAFLGDFMMMSNFTVEGQLQHDTRFDPYVESKIISNDYFRAAGISLLAGRPFNSTDDTKTAYVVIVNETLERHYWPAGQAVGKRLSLEHDEKTGSPIWSEIIAVAADIRDVSLRTPPKAQVYVQFPHSVPSSMTILVRTGAQPTALEPAIRDAVWSVDRDQPINKMATIEQALTRSVSESKFHTLLLGIFAALGLSITLVGIYGVISYTVSQRTREIGIRMALGAQSHDVLRHILWDGMKLALAGLAIGIVAALGLTRLLTSFLFEVRATDPAAFALVAVLLACVALAACYLPARRATKVDPLLALRHE